MTVVVARAQWHGLSVEDLVLGLAGLLFAVVLVKLFRSPHARGNAPPGDEEECAGERTQSDETSGEP